MSFGPYEILPPLPVSTLECRECGLLQVKPQTQPCGVCREKRDREGARVAVAAPHVETRAAAPPAVREPARPVETVSECRWSEVQRAQREADYPRDEEERYQAARQRGLENEARANGAQWCELHSSFWCNC